MNLWVEIRHVLNCREIPRKIKGEKKKNNSHPHRQDRKTPHQDRMIALDSEHEGGDVVL